MVVSIFTFTEKGGESQLPRHKSAVKSMKTDVERRLRNRYAKSTLRTIVKKVKVATDHTQAEIDLKSAISQLDKAARRGIIHKNKAARSKSRLIKQVRALAATK